MRWLWLVALAACSNTTTRAGGDAALDSSDQPDARWFYDARNPDAYAPRPCDAPPMFADGFAPSRVLHVSPGAVHGDGSAAAPFGSIAAAAAIATPGTFIQLAPGWHATNQFIPNLRGTQAAPIWIGGVWGTMPKIMGGIFGLHLTRPAYVVIQNLEVGGQDGHAINIDDGVAHAGDTEAIAIVNVYAHNVTADWDNGCIKASGVNGLAIYDSRARGCTRGVDLVGVHGGVVARTGFESTYGRAVVARGGSTDVDIRQNRIDAGGGLVIELGGVTLRSEFRPAVTTTNANAEARRVRAFNNFIVGDSGAPFAFNGCIDCLVAHNFVAGSPKTLIRVMQDTPPGPDYAFESTKNGRVINNSFTWDVSALSSYVESGPNTAVTTFTFSHNLWQSPPMLPVTEDGSVISSFSGYSQSPGPGQFCDGPEAGAAAPLPEIEGTIEGFCRVMGDAPTIGPQMQTLGGCTL